MLHLRTYMDAATCICTFISMGYFLGDCFGFVILLDILLFLLLLFDFRKVFLSADYMIMILMLMLIVMMMIMLLMLLLSKHLYYKLLFCLHNFYLKKKNRGKFCYFYYYYCCCCHRLTLQSNKNLCVLNCKQNMILS